MCSFRNILNIKPRFSIFRTSLRARVAFGVALPVFIMMTGLSLVHYWRELQLLDEQIRLSTVQLGDMLNNSISYAMLIKDEGYLRTALSDVSSLDNVEQVQIIGISGQVLFASETQSDFIPIGLEDPECWACHQYAPEERPRAIELKNPSMTLRISTPVINHPECVACHPDTDSHLGVLLIDFSLADVRAHLLQDLRLDSTITILATAIITIGMFHLLNRLVVRRIEAFRAPLTAYAAGDYSVRLEKCARVEDEICQLADTFNHMADEIERCTNVRELEARTGVRQQAIIDERERIARELHDGLAQVLGYVSTKVMAVRLNLQKENIQEADRQLLQLEEAAHGVSLDVREGILGLKLASQVDTNLVEVLEEYIEQFNNLSNVHAEFFLPTDFVANLLPEEVLHLLRVVQESLTNARKHANASQITVSLDRENSLIKLEVMDNGQGFDIKNFFEENDGNFGLTTMQERAEEIGANLEISSEPGKGTRVSVKFDLEGERC